MSFVIPFGVGPCAVQLVSDGAYAGQVRSLLRRAQRRALCSLFIVDPSPVRDPELLVDGLLEALETTTWLGVDTRLLVGGSRTNDDIAHVAELTRARARQRGVSARWLTSADVRGSHVKLVVADDSVLLGAHNWSPGSLGGGQTQDSVRIESADLAAYTAELFESQWQRAAGGG